MMKRLFAAVKIEPNEDLLKVYYSMRQLLKHENIKWVEPDNLHFTLKFFGETPESKIKKINQVLENIASEIEPFDMSISKTGIFGSSYNPRVIWFGFDEEDDLKDMGERILSRLANAGFLSDRQNFVPHLTIGRIKGIKQRQLFQTVIDDFKEIQIQKFRVNEFYLYKSVLKPSGPIYTVQKCFQLTPK